MTHSQEKVKPLYWVGSSKKDLQAMPAEVQDVFGFALHLAQVGAKHVHAKPLAGFGSAGVVEVVEDQAGTAQDGPGVDTRTTQGSDQAGGHAVAPMKGSPI